MIDLCGDLVVPFNSVLCLYDKNGFIYQICRPFPLAIFEVILNFPKQKMDTVKTMHGNKILVLSKVVSLYRSQKHFFDHLRS